MINLFIVELKGCEGMERVENVKENKMGTMKIPKLLFSVSVPIIISMIVQALYNVVDSIFVARFDPINGTGALSHAFPIQNLILALSLGLAVGVNALLSRALGSKSFERANRIAGQGIFLMLCGGIIFLLVGIFAVKPYVSTQEEAGTLIFDYSVQYISTVCIASVGVFVQVIMERFLQATGKSILSMATQLSGAVVNLILDPIMIFGLFGVPAMGALGAALATVIGQWIAAIIGIVLNLTCNKEIKLSLKNMIPDFPLIKEILAIGIPAVFMQAIGSVMTYSMNYILKGFSTEAMNVFGVYFKLQSFVFMPVFGLNNGMIPIIAYNYGAKRKDRVFKTMRLALVCAVAYMLLGLTVFQLLPTYLLGMFNAESVMLEIGIPALRTISISFIFAGISVVSISACQALGNSVYSLIVSIGRQLVVLIPAAFLLSLTGVVSNVWWAFPIAEVVSLVLSVSFVIAVMKKAFSEKPSTIISQIIGVDCRCKNATLAQEGEASATVEPHEALDGEGEAE